VIVIASVLTVNIIDAFIILIRTGTGIAKSLADASTALMIIITPIRTTRIISTITIMGQTCTTAAKVVIVTAVVRATTLQGTTGANVKVPQFQ